MTSPENEKRSDEARWAELAAAATEGPWFARDRGVGWELFIDEPDSANYGMTADGSVARMVPEGFRTSLGRGEDAEFIAAARTAVPVLLARLDRVRALLDSYARSGHDDALIRKGDMLAEFTSALAADFGSGVQS